MLGSLGWQELLIILVILALLFGASRVASLGGALGRGIREFRSEATGGSDAKGETPDDTEEPKEADAAKSKSGDGGSSSS
ncbi:MAG: twin-arginine translocase TatA/TatE family subunit [Chloroflexi bacterium]|nr:twin-arginine translocase TatA/TatE family subunit [Chloroflexota bacterium]